MAGTPILREREREEKKPRQPSKSLSVKDKNKMCSILGFLLYMKETGKLTEEDARKMMEELPLYSTARVQIEFFEKEVFDLKKIEMELWKPMVVENKNNKKNKKTKLINENENEKTEKKKRQRKPREKKEGEAHDIKKRGRKVKKQIVQFNEEDDNEVPPIDDLNDMIMIANEIEIEEEMEAGEINENDLDTILQDIAHEKQNDISRGEGEGEKELVEEEMKEEEIVNKKKEKKVKEVKEKAPPKKAAKKTTKINE